VPIFDPQRLVFAMICSGVLPSLLSSAQAVASSRTMVAVVIETERVFRMLYSFVDRFDQESSDSTMLIQDDSTPIIFLPQ
jgi:hypothetical protein